ncbi:4741_t:CDS:2, partial [Gigaspora rosea]
KQTNDITTITTNYVATLNDSAPYGASCKHEDIECIGNIQQLCFRYFYPDQATFFNFLLCLNRYIPKIGSRDWAMQCSKEMGVDYTPVDKCANSNHGRSLFIKSVGITNSYGVTKSCTIYIKGKLRCIKDDYWYDCPGGHEVNDFVRSIQDTICDECNYGSYQGRCVICGAPGVSDAYYCKECVLQEKDRDGCPKIVNLGSSKTDLFYERKKYGFKKR